MNFNTKYLNTIEVSDCLVLSMIIKIITLKTKILGKYINLFYLNTFEYYSIIVFQKTMALGFENALKLYKYIVFICCPTLTMAYMSLASEYF